MKRKTWEHYDGDTSLLYMSLSDNEVREVLGLYTGMRVIVRKRYRGEVIVNGGIPLKGTRFGVKLR